MVEHDAENTPAALKGKGRVMPGEHNAPVSALHYQKRSFALLARVDEPALAPVLRTESELVRVAKCRRGGSAWRAWPAPSRNPATPSSSRLAVAPDAGRVVALVVVALALLDPAVLVVDGTP